MEPSVTRPPSRTAATGPSTAAARFCRHGVRTATLAAPVLGALVSVTALAAGHAPATANAAAADINADAPATTPVIAIIDDRWRRRPGVEDRERVESPQPDPNANSAFTRINPPDPLAPQPYEENFLPVDDRWRLAADLGLVPESPFNAYGRNLYKGDRPIYGDDWFFNFSLISDTTFEHRRIPTPVAPQAPLGNGRLDVIAIDDTQQTFNQNIIVAIVAYQGDTVFRPPDYEFRFTPVFNFNRTDVGANRALFIDPSRGDSRSDGHLGIQELFIDKHLRNVSSRYDFDSLRVGIQPFSSDFRGFLFQDLQPGIRLFGNRDNNRYQYNLAWFRRLEKDTNSGLNNLDEDPRKDDIYLFNVYAQDFPVLGFFSQDTWVYNRNKEGDEGNFFDRNGFLQRPASIGLEKPRNYQVHYLGLSGDGHFDRLNLTFSTYYATGRQNRSILVDSETDIRAGFVAGEFSVDFDWIRVRGSALYASGDSDPFDDTETGFDAIFENPIFAGADTSFFIRQGVPNLAGGGVTLSTRNGVLNNLRSSKEHGQSNFTNPGIKLLGIGADFDITPAFRVSANINRLWFDTTQVLEVVRNQGSIDKDIGWDLSLATIYRPFFTQNLVLRVSYALLVPGQGYKDLFGPGTNHSFLLNFIATF